MDYWNQDCNRDLRNEIIAQSEALKMLLNASFEGPGELPQSDTNQVVW